MSITVISFHDDWRQPDLVRRAILAPTLDKARNIAEAQLVGGACYAQIQHGNGAPERVRMEGVDHEKA